MICVYGESGFAVIQISDQDKRRVTKLKIDPRTLNFHFPISYLALRLAVGYLNLG